MDETYQNILVALDGSRLAEKAFTEAVRIASANNGRLTLISIINDAELATSAFALLKRIHDASQKGVMDVIPFVEVGNPKQVIIKYAADNASDLIVIGATGKGAITQSLVGSTTAYVVNHAPCNVLVVR